jgi:phenylpropionate dioxygenase-like ring-hydroxylating dioxygenase large terminal subunit
MLRKAWYAVLPSKALSDKPLKARVHGMDFLLLRDASKIPHAYNAYCPHRGCDLSFGSVINQELVCPFHGWRFNQNGLCTHIPANRTGAAIPPAAQLTTYPACDEADLVWVYTYQEGPVGETHSLKMFPELKENGWTYVPFRTSWNAHFSRVVESVLDVSHLPFVHPETAGSDISPVVEGPDYAATETGIVIHPIPFAPSHPMQPVTPPSEMGERTEIELVFPNNWIIRTPMGDETWMCTFLTFTPVDDTTTDIFGVAMRNFEPDSPLLDTLHINHTEFVLNQDKGIVEHLWPKVAPDFKQEAHVASDGPTIRFRQMLFKSLQQESL